MTGNWSRE